MVTNEIPNRLAISTPSPNCFTPNFRRSFSVLLKLVTQW